MGGDEFEVGNPPGKPAHVLPSDPFDLPIEVSPLHRIDPMTPPANRRVLVDELRGLVDRGEYHVDPEVVALAVMNADGRFVQKGDAE